MAGYESFVWHGVDPATPDEYEAVESGYAHACELITGSLRRRCGEGLRYPVRLRDLAAVLRGRMKPDEVPPASCAYDGGGVDRLFQSFVKK